MRGYTPRAQKEGPFTFLLSEVLLCPEKGNKHKKRANQKSQKLAHMGTGVLTNFRPFFCYTSPKRGKNIILHSLFSLPAPTMGTPGGPINNNLSKIPTF
jgi:hypothetical protein